MDFSHDKRHKLSTSKKLSYGAPVGFANPGCNVENQGEAEDKPL
jgi:hypothetical protein